MHIDCTESLSFYFLSFHSISLLCWGKDGYHSQTVLLGASRKCSTSVPMAAYISDQEQRNALHLESQFPALGSRCLEISHLIASGRPVHGTTMLAATIRLCVIAPVVNSKNRRAGR